MAGTTIRIGIDLGGTKTEVIALSDTGESLIRHRVSSPKNDYQATIRTIANLVIKVETELKQRGTVGIATPGAISQISGTLKNSNSVWLNGKPLKQDLQTALQRQVRLANDANCFVLSEAADGAAKGAEVVFGVIVGTGTGGGIVVNRELITGCNSIAGEWGHNPLPWLRTDELPGPRCYCGKQGCIETFLSGPAIASDYLAETGTERQAKQIAELSEQHDKAAEQVLQRYEDRMARALAGVINVLDPNVIVLGGGMSNIGRLYNNVPNLWGNYVFSDHVDTKLVAAKHGDSSGVRGAAWLW